VCCLKLSTRRAQKRTIKAQELGARIVNGKKTIREDRDARL